MWESGSLHHGGQESCHATTLQPICMTSDIMHSVNSKACSRMLTACKSCPAAPSDGHLVEEV